MRVGHALSGIFVINLRGDVLLMLDDARETRETDETRTLRAATRPSAFMRQVASAEGDESRARGGRRLVVRADAEWDDESEQKLRHVTARGR